MLPIFAGRPIRVQMRRSLGPHLASTSIARRVILLDSEVLARRGDFERILVHEMFHFVWVRLPNSTRYTWESLLATELDRKSRGELGWSAQWRKEKLARRDVRGRSPAWRRYACESFCDTAAWLYSNLRAHDEFTLRPRFCRSRRTWFQRAFPATLPIPI